jgi:predicted esterase
MLRDIIRADRLPLRLGILTVLSAANSALAQSPTTATAQVPAVLPPPQQSPEPATPQAAAPGSEGRQVASFTNSAPYASAAEITRHFGYKVGFPDYDVKAEKFRLVVPRDYSTNGTWGLLVWVSAENEADVPTALLTEAAAHRLLMVSAYKSGNDRHPLDRFRLALDAACNMCRAYQIDRRRIFVGGFSGGSRIASMLGVAYGDLFTGTLSICGVNFYRTVRGVDGEEYPTTYAPDPGAAQRANQNGRFVLITGETDPNRRSTKAIADRGFTRDGFRRVLYLEVPGMGHTIPDATVLRKALDYLEGGPSSR